MDLPAPAIRGYLFDSSLAVAEATVQGVGVALLPARLLERDRRQGVWSDPSPQRLGLAITG